MSFRKNQIRHIRVMDIRSKIVKGWGMKDLVNFCTLNLGVGTQTAISYIDEAAEPYRKKFELEQKK